MKSILVGCGDDLHDWSLLGEEFEHHDGRNLYIAQRLRLSAFSVTASVGQGLGSLIDWCADLADGVWSDARACQDSWVRAPSYSSCTATRNADLPGRLHHQQ